MQSHRGQLQGKSSDTSLFRASVTPTMTKAAQPGFEMGTAKGQNSKQGWHPPFLD